MTISSESKLQDNLSQKGFTIPNLEINGKFIRFDRSGKKNGWFVGYALHDNGKQIIIANYGDWKTGEKYSFKPTGEFSTNRKNEINRKIEELKEAVDAEIKRKQAAAKILAQKNWNEASSNNDPRTIQYLVNKKIPHLFGVRTTTAQRGGQALLVPTIDSTDEELSGLQIIYDNGDKFFREGQKLSGCYFPVFNGECNFSKESELIFAEGFSTSASISLALNRPVICCFNASNLVPVTKAFKIKYPDKNFVICADDDQYPNEKGETHNTGREYAEKISATLPAIVIYPKFKSLETEPTDFNDLHCLEGIDSVREQIESEISSCKEKDSIKIDLPEIPDSERTLIKVCGGIMDKIVDESETCLAESKINVYVYMDRLVKMVEKDTGETSLVVIDHHCLRYLLTKIINFQKYDRRAKHFVPTDCPMHVAQAFISKKVWPKIPTLKAMIDAPLMKPDGSILSKPGYDPATQLFANIDPRWPQIPDNCSLDGAQAALKKLKEPFREFPFETEEDRAVAISIAPTLIQAPVMASSPIIGVSANTAGAGKSMTVDVSCNIAYGRKISPIALSHNEEEAAKQIVAAILSGQKAIFLDNISRQIESDLLCSLSTQGGATIRPLGSSQPIRVDRPIPILMTGNGMSLKGDLCRRTTISLLDAKHEKPEQRKFDWCPKEYALKHRQELVNACLIIMLAYRQAGHPDCGLTPLGSFEEWSRTIRSALVWAGASDPCLVMARTQERDPERESLAELLSLWHMAYGSSPILVRDILNADLATKTKNQSLLQVIESIRGRGDAVRSLSRYILRFEGRIINGLKFSRKTPLDGTTRWAVEEAGLEGLKDSFLPSRRNLSDDKYIEVVGNKSSKSSKPAQNKPIRLEVSQ